MRFIIFSNTIGKGFTNTAFPLHLKSVKAVKLYWSIKSIN